MLNPWFIYRIKRYDAVWKLFLFSNVALGLPTTFGHSDPIAALDAKNLAFGKSWKKEDRRYSVQSQQNPIVFYSAMMGAGMA